MIPRSTSSRVLRKAYVSEDEENYVKVYSDLDALDIDLPSENTISLFG